MTQNLFDLTYAVARELGHLREGIATGGTTTTLVDTARLQNQYVDDYFNLGTVWILPNAAGGSPSAPVGEYARVSDFVKSSGTATIEAVSSAIDAGDRYAIATEKFPLDTIISFINAALAEISIENTDLTTVDTASAQTEYTLPTAMLDYDIQVWIQRITGDANDNRWRRFHDWYISEPVAGTGTAKVLIMRSQPPYAYDLKIVYFTPHNALYASTDELRESVDINRVVLDAAYRCLLWKQAQHGDTDADLARRINELVLRVERAKTRSPIRRNAPKLATLGEIDLGYEAL